MLRRRPAASRLIGHRGASPPGRGQARPLRDRTRDRRGPVSPTQGTRRNGRPKARRAPLLPRRPPFVKERAYPWRGASTQRTPPALGAGWYRTSLTDVRCCRGSRGPPESAIPPSPRIGAGTPRRAPGCPGERLRSALRTSGWIVAHATGLPSSSSPALVVPTCTACDGTGGCRPCPRAR